VQLHAGFGFDAAAARIDYLAALGISHLYCSPYLQAVSGSMHGSDVVDYRRVNEELGGAAAHTRLSTVL
jgi:(1->4)-alpha-D-glucan 1-alpha-D-glucosylmutase